MKKLITLCVSLVACLMVVGVATAAPVVYNLTATDPSGFGGTITIDVGNPASSEGGADLYQYGNGVTAFSIYQPGNGVTFTPADSVLDFDVLLLNADNSAIEFFCDVDGAFGGALYGSLDFSVSSQTFDTQGTVTGAALTPAGGGGLVLLNGSFESPVWVSGEPAAAHWNRFGSEIYSFVAAYPGYEFAGPTDGTQAYCLDDRSPWSVGPKGGGVWQSLGTGAALKALGPTLVATFDARKGTALDWNAEDRPYVGFWAYFTVGGVKDTTDDLFLTHADGVGLRICSVIKADTGRNMDSFSISMPTAGMPDGAEVRLYFENQWEMDGTPQTEQSRTFIDNVQVTVGTGGGATPGTLILVK